MKISTTPALRSVAVAALCLGLLAATVPSTAWADDGTEARFKGLVDRHAEALVTLKFVLSFKFEGGMSAGMDSQEVESETSGLMIEPTGLVLVSNAQLNGLVGPLMAAMGGMDISASPKAIKVLVDEDEEGLEATLIARDTDLDLAWVRIDEPGERRFPAVDLTTSAGKLALGQDLYLLRRLGPYFDRAPSILEMRIGGETRRPRRLLVPAVSLSLGFGLPVFTTEGTFAGFTVLQFPGGNDGGDGMNPAAFLGQRAGFEQAFAGLILPAAEVLRATEAAKQLAAEQEAEEAAEESEDGSQEGPGESAADS